VAQHRVAGEVASLALRNAAEPECWTARLQLVVVNMSSKAETGIHLGSRKSEYIFVFRALLDRRMPNRWPLLLLILVYVIGVGWIVADSDCGMYIALLLCVGGIYVVWRLWPIKVVLYERGITYSDRKGIRRVSWNQIEQVWRTVPNNGLGRYDIQTKSGEKIALSYTLFKYAELGKSIEEGVHQVLQPKYLAVIQSGQRITFGPFGLDNRGVYFNQKHIPWDKVSSIITQPPKFLFSTVEGMTPAVVIKEKQKLLTWARVKEEKIPNVYTFYNLVSLFHRGQAD
jgi:hypothetical protein